MEELINLCKHEDIEFESSFLFNRPYKYNSKEKLRKLFWLVELREFIYNKFNVYITTTVNDKKFIYSWLFNGEEMTSKHMYDNESLALQAGIEWFLKNYIVNK